MIFFAACTPGPGHVEMMLRATDDMPLNFGFSGKGNTSDSESLKDVLRSGAAGFKRKYLFNIKIYCTVFSMSSISCMYFISSTRGLGNGKCWI